MNEPTVMSNPITYDASSDISRISALFDALGLGQIDADEDGCFVMSYDEQTSLHFQIVPGADLLKVAVSVCTLDASCLARDLRVVLRTNLDVPRASLSGTLSVVPSTKEVLFNSAVPLLVPDADSAIRPVRPPELGSFLTRVLEAALGWRRRLARDLHAHAPTAIESHIQGDRNVIRG